MTTHWHNISGKKVFEVKGYDFGKGILNYGVYKGYWFIKPDKSILPRLNLIELWFGFYLMLPNKHYKKIRKYLNTPKKPKNQEKIYRSDLKLYEERKWFIWKYSIFGKPNKYTLFKK